MVMGTGILGIVLSQSQGLVSQRLKAAGVKKVNIQGQEAGLYALSVAKQMVMQDSVASMPSIGFKNPLNPTSLSDIQLRSLETNPNPTRVNLDSGGALRVVAPDPTNMSIESMNQVFRNKNFNIAGQYEANVLVKPYSWEPFPTGYGIKTVYMEAAAPVSQSNNKSALATKARIELQPPPASCSLTATVNGLPIDTSVPLASNAQVSVNLSCKGVVLSAALYNGNQPNPIAKIDPPTAAKSYDSTVPALLPPTTIKGPGNHILTAEARLVSGEPITVAPLNFTIAAGQSEPGPMACIHKCTCNSDKAKAASGCDGGPGNPTRFYNPFNPNKSLGNTPSVPMPVLTGDPRTDAKARQTLTDFAQTHGIWDTGLRWQGAAYAIGGYPRMLVCGDVWDKVHLYAFDPKNNCKQIDVGDRTDLGCLQEGTLVTIEPGYRVPIETLRSGDRVWSPTLQRQVPIIEVTAGPENRNMIELHAGDKTVVVTETHPMPTPMGMRQARDLYVGDELLVGSKYQTITAIERKLPPAGTRVWNLRLPTDQGELGQTFEADGIVVGDLGLQETLERGHE
jgi:hypothetical protein